VDKIAAVAGFQHWSSLGDDLVAVAIAGVAVAGAATVGTVDAADDLVERVHTV